MLTYATSTDLQEWTSQAPPANVATLLRAASMLVRQATKTAIYDVDTTGAPTDAAIAEAMRDATCSQVATWLALSIDPAKGAADTSALVTGKSIGGASIQYSVYASQVEARATAATHLAAEAIGILRDAGLTPTPWTSR